MRLCPSRYQACQEGKGQLWEAITILFKKLLRARLWAGYQEDRDEKDPVCIFRELRGEKHTCPAELNSRVLCRKAVEARAASGEGLPCVGDWALEDD